MATILFFCGNMPKAQAIWKTLENAGHQVVDAKMQHECGTVRLPACPDVVRVDTLALKNGFGFTHGGEARPVPVFVLTSRLPDRPQSGWQPVYLVCDPDDPAQRACLPDQLDLLLFR